MGQFLTHLDLPNVNQVIRIQNGSQKKMRILLKYFWKAYFLSAKFSLASYECSFLFAFRTEKRRRDFSSCLPDNFMFTLLYIWNFFFDKNIQREKFFLNFNNKIYNKIFNNTIFSLDWNKVILLCVYSIWKIFEK